jgi:TetR/AcrR family transcriptional regulator
MLYTKWYNAGMDNREEILKKALLLFSRQGYENTGVQQLVDACRITKPTLYHYFGSKDGVLKELLKRHFGTFETALRAAADYNRDLVATIEKMTAELFRFAQDNPQFYLFYLSLTFMPKESESAGIVGPSVREISRIVEEMFIRAGEHNGHLKGRQREYTVTYLGMMNAHIREHLNAGTPLEGEFVHRIVMQFLHGIYA